MSTNLERLRNNVAFNVRYDDKDALYLQIIEDLFAKINSDVFVSEMLPPLYTAFSNNLTYFSLHPFRVEYEYKNKHRVFFCGSYANASYLIASSSKDYNRNNYTLGESYEDALNWLFEDEEI